MDLTTTIVASTYVRTLIHDRIHEVIRHDRGASLVEYALLIALIALVCVAAVATLGGATKSRFASVATSF